MKWEEDLIREQYLKELRRVGEYLVKNAEEIVGKDSMMNLDQIDISIELAYDRIPKLNISKRVSIKNELFFLFARNLHVVL